MTNAKLLKILKRCRDSLQYRLKSISKFISEIETIIETNDQLSQESCGLIKIRLESAKEIFNEFKQTQGEIERECDEQDVADECEQRSTFEKEYFAIINSLNNLSIQNNQGNSGHTNELAGVATNEFSHTDSIKLPIINVPKFSGAHTDWLEFKEVFESLIHNNQGINQIQRFHYLKAALIGNASKIIQKFSLTQQNYDTAWNVLCSRYSNKDLLLHSHIKAIFDLPSTNSLDSKTFRNLSDELTRNLEFLSRLGNAEQQRDAILLFTISNKFDKNTAKDWEDFISNEQSKSIKTLETFLNSKADILEKLDQRNPNNAKTTHRTDKRQTFISAGHECLCCKSSDHAIYKCSDFLKLTPKQRSEKIRRIPACVNCLKTGHQETNCYSGKCRVCKKAHNTLLHYDTNVSLNSSINQKERQVLLSTANIKVFDSKGNPHQARALLDCGSQSNYITYSFFKKLGLRKNNTYSEVTGIGNVVSNIKHECSITIQSNISKFSTKILCLLLQCISDSIPNQAVDSSVNFLIQNHSNIALADPSFDEPQPIDILIGADLFWKVLREGKLELGKNKPCLNNTEFGWIVSGGTYTKQKPTSICNLSKQASIQNQLLKFWEIEEIDSNKIATCPNDQIVEKHFSETFYRDEQGRFVVKMPFKDNPAKLGKSRQVALKRFYNLESKLRANAELEQNYSKFMQEYEVLKHMKKIQHPIDDEVGYYMPHHAVLKADSITTKCRVVFDASAVTDTGISLNNILHVGPVVQQDLNSILMRFRQHAYVFSADVAKMYRQVLITPEQTKYQRILWRSDTNSEINTYELQTVTYGTATGSFLATRCLNQLAIENKQRFPEASEIILRDFYVDDLISGTDSVNSAKILCTQITDILASGCFELKKWCSNNDSILEEVDSSEHLTQYINFGEDAKTKLLGIQWSFSNDTLAYHIGENNVEKTITKRNILSAISRIFDPLGLLAPVVILTKIILQQLWLIKSEWDDEVPYDLKNKWLKFKSKLQRLNKLAIPRFAFCSQPSLIEFHGFCDASQDAYGACVYVRCVDSKNNIQIHLFTAKSRVAPLKVISIPRLELCGALLLADLMQKVKTSISCNADTYFWTDSQVVLSWLKNESKLFQTFVSNRISKIQEVSDIKSWYYINTEQNPADLISRGLQPDELLNSKFWWQGPPWLSQHKTLWPRYVYEDIPSSLLPETKKAIQTYLTTNDNQNLISKFSSLIKLKRVTAWCLRFIHNSKAKLSSRVGPLAINELNEALQMLVKISQDTHFKEEFQLLSKNKVLPLKNKVKGLTPFLDHLNILRVGGRLKHSNLAVEQKNPILLSAKCNLTKLLFTYEHLQLYHAGPQLLLYTMRQKYWVPNGRNLARIIVRRCVICVRAKPIIQMPLMGNLPVQRVQVSLPFLNTGTDFAGPFFVKEMYGRGRKTFKCYVCLFVCVTTKAVHLETVTDLTTNSFMSLLRRFVARRGQPSNIYSDNGKTYVGANSELGKFLKDNNSILAEKAAARHINWHFIPAYSPNFGGLWEAGVKSVKHHLKRVLVNASVTFEQFTTVIIEIEGILNSRPISPLSSDPNDFQPLTPAHFLIGRSITSIPETDMRQIAVNRLSNYQHLLQLKQHVWERWHKEYITELQVRTKWKTTIPNIKINTLVIIKDDHAPPLQWKLGRVVKLHPGEDGVVRVIEIKTSNGIIKRAVSRVCVLPVDNTETAII